MSGLKHLNKKVHITADQLLIDSFELAKRIYQSNFNPESMLVVWRGGASIGKSINEYLIYKEEEVNTSVVSAKSYVGVNLRDKVIINGIQPIITNMKENQRALIVDDVFDTGKTIEKIVETIKPKTNNVKIATVFYKPKNNLTNLKPDFYIRETDKWIIFPHELQGLEEEDLKNKGGELYLMLKAKKTR